VDRLFLDANVLYSATESSTSRFQIFWNINDVELITSVYALREARRNLDSDALRDKLTDLTKGLTIIEDIPAESSVALSLNLSEKDRPILLAAIQVKATHLLTGDKKHFGPYYGQTVEGVLILPPAEYLRTRSGR
jgi:predicted nucleic acid-binding protein